MFPIVSSKWLNENLSNENLVILDASQKNNKAGLESEFKNICIKGSRIFDIKNDFSETTSLFPNTLLSPEKFEMACQKLGINQNSRIVVYDNLGIYTSPRVWWMFKIMGFENISVLDGGLPNWIDNNFETEKIIQKKYSSGDFKVAFKSEKVTFFNGIKTNLKTQEFLVIDARSVDRFNGLIPESRKGLRSGNIPNSINIPHFNVIKNGKMKSKTELTKLFANFVSDTKKPLIFTCGSGITACIILLASELVLENKKSIYDGSWTEYAQLEK
jgi:thiosulfate/3-mercaptopyruvate sulfurtransferase